jgi:hypothetical protein
VRIIIKKNLFLFVKRFSGFTIDGTRGIPVVYRCSYQKILIVSRGEEGGETGRLRGVL